MKTSVYLPDALADQAAALVCHTCPGHPGGGVVIDRWRPGQRGPVPLAWERHADPLNHPMYRQRYLWQGVVYRITRVSERHRWANIEAVEPSGYSWTKRQPLPLPAGSILLPAADTDE